MSQYTVFAHPGEELRIQHHVVAHVVRDQQRLRIQMLQRARS